MRDRPGSGEDVSHQLFVVRFERTNRFDVPVRYDQDVGPCHGVDIAEGGHLFIAVDNFRSGSAGDDLAENA